MMALEILEEIRHRTSVWPLLRHDRSGTIHGMAEHQSPKDANYLHQTEPSRGLRQRYLPQVGTGR